ncbi:MAG: hypothetical protein Q7R70_02475 [Candidatus Diapherotrites archaeon]|nr:hypothetical protein [Candidatus Diapherotrites archaeon]
MLDEDNVRRNMKRISKSLKIKDFSAVNSELSAKRLAWLEQNKELLETIEGSSVRKAFEIILFKYMKLEPSDIQVVFENDRKIVWNAFNECPVLEACKRLNADTRIACKEGWEKPVQEMASFINPKLKFSRNYETLRPFGKCCNETIELAKS